MSGMSAIGDGVKYNVALSSATTYTMTMYLTGFSGASLSSVEVGRSENGIADTACYAAATLAAGFQKISCTFTTGTRQCIPRPHLRVHINTPRISAWFHRAQRSTKLTRNVPH
jgi:hypothetical protein